MDEQTWTFNGKDKSEWGEGVWTHEPDKIYWIDPLTEYPCLIRRNALGVLCGYVAIEPSHPLYECDHEDAPVRCMAV